MGSPNQLYILIYKGKEDFLETKKFWNNIEELCKKISLQDVILF